MNSPTRSRRNVAPLSASSEEAVEEVSPDLVRPCDPPAPGPSALLACVLHEYACSGARRPGRIRATWPPDLSAPFLNSLLVRFGNHRVGRRLQDYPDRSVESEV